MVPVEIEGSLFDFCVGDIVKSNNGLSPQSPTRIFTVEGFNQKKKKLYLQPIKNPYCVIVTEESKHFLELLERPGDVSDVSEVSNVSDVQ